MSGRLAAAAAVLAACALWIAQPVPVASAQGVTSSPVPLWDPSVADGLAYDAQIYRVLHNVSPRRNVAVFRYELPNGEVRTLAIDSEPFSPGGGRHLGEGHSEERLEHILRKWGIEPEWVTDIYSELEPCSLPGHNCRGMLGKTFPKLRSVQHSLEYPYGHSTPEEKAANKRIRSASVRALEGEAKNLMARNVVRGGQGPIRLPVVSPRFMPRFPGGIDFTSLELRYVADTGSGARQGLRYSYRGTPSAVAGDPNVALSSAGQASDAFFAWLTLPPQSFWVNLNPAEPNRIIDPQFARSDAGRVLLEADLRLKKDTVALINPDTTVGDRFWDALEAIYGDRADKACISGRVWIVPEPATVRATDHELYILDAPLTVKTQSMLINNPDTGTPGCPQESKAVEAQKEDLIRRLILPPVIHAVNTAPQYAALRRVYTSRVAAEWFRKRNASDPTVLNRFVDSGRIGRWAARTPWDPKVTFNTYLDSLRHGEWTAKRNVTVNGQTVQRTLIYGGVDFSRTPERPVAKHEFKARWPHLAASVRRSQNGTAGSGAERWLGGGDPRSAALPRVVLRIHGARRAPAGATLTLRLAATNPTSRAIRHATVCDRLPSGLDYVRANRHRRLRAGWSCWQLPRVGAGATTSIRVTVRALRGGRLINRATASVPGSAEGAMAQRALRVSRAQAGRPGGVTG
jgi:hypothetical protein